MLTRLRLENFKSWQDTGNIALRPITGFFGTNSSGKSGLIHALLLLKQTAESADRGIVLNFGGVNSVGYVDLGDFASVVHGHGRDSALGISLNWQMGEPVRIADTYGRRDVVSSKDMGFRIIARMEEVDALHQVVLEKMSYSLGGAVFGMRREKNGKYKYDLFSKTENFRFVRFQGRAWKFDSPVKCYGFPDKVRLYYQNAGFLTDLEFEMKQQLESIYYLGPLRAYPERAYTWHGYRPADVGGGGEFGRGRIAGVAPPRRQDSKRHWQKILKPGGICCPLAQKARPDLRLSRRTRLRKRGLVQGKGS